MEYRKLLLGSGVDFAQGLGGVNRTTNIPICKSSMFGRFVGFVRLAFIYREIEVI